MATIDNPSKKQKYYQKDDNGDYQLTSFWTHSDAVEFPDGENLTDKFGDMIDDDTVSESTTWSSYKIREKFRDSGTIPQYTLTTDDQNRIVLDEYLGGVPIRTNPVTAPYATTSGTADKLSVSDGAWFLPMYFSGGVPTNTGVVNYCGTLRSNSSQTIPIRYGMIAIWRGAQSSIPTVAYIDMWGGVVYTSQNPAITITPNTITVGELENTVSVTISNASTTNHMNFIAFGCYNVSD